MASIARRDFLKLAGAAALSLAFAPRPDAEKPPLGQPPQLGRTTWPLNLYDKPTFLAQRLGRLHFNDLIVIRERATSDYFPHNPVWFRSDRGWVQSSSVQVVSYSLNRPVLERPRWRVPGRGDSADDAGVECAQ